MSVRRDYCRFALVLGICVVFTDAQCATKASRQIKDSSCSLLGCDESRNADCEPGEGVSAELYFCYCKAGSCPVNGACPIIPKGQKKTPGPHAACGGYEDQNECEATGCRWVGGECQAPLCQPDDPARRREGSPCAFRKASHDCDLAIMSRRRHYGAEAFETCQSTCTEEVGCEIACSERKQEDCKGTCTWKSSCEDKCSMDSVSSCLLLGCSDSQSTCVNNQCVCGDGLCNFGSVCAKPQSLDPAYTAAAAVEETVDALAIALRPSLPVCGAAALVGTALAMVAFKCAWRRGPSQLEKSLITEDSQ